jgi:hypothetical protein
MRKLLPFSWLAVGLLGCGGVSGPPAPRLIEGGGVADGKISSALNVYVTDEDSRAVLSGASVRVGESSSATPCTVLTDSTGLAKFTTADCPSLKGPVTIIVSTTAAYTPVTWIGVNAANVTIPLRATVPAAIDTATASGTINGWASLPVPPANHQTLALIIYSQTNDLGDRRNEIMQGKRNVNVNGTDYPLDSNLCVINASVSDCSWTLTTRTGPQAHLALIVDQDTKGNNVDADDTFTVTGYAIKTGLDFAKGDMKTGEALTMIADAYMQTFTASFPSLPTGMDVMGAFPALELGPEGRIPFTIPALDMTHTSTRVPKLTGALAGKSYSLIAQAQDGADVKQPASLAWLHGVDINSTVALSSWLPPPSNISVLSGTYAFSAVAGATVHGGEIQNMLGDRVWSITIFDGPTSFTLPGLSSDPIPVGTVNFQVQALQIPGADVGNFKIDDLKEKITAISSDVFTFTHP